MSMTCGEATMRLLARYGVSTVFGIPGVHTLDLCRGLSGGGNSGEITHIRARNEQGAGYMAEGWARATGEPGVMVVISGPGVTNAATALGQCYADSVPLLMISAEPETRTLGKGWGVLHEITEQRRVTEPLCAFSETARSAADVPYLIARAFSVFASQRPRPVHISLPIDVQAEIVEDVWEPMPLPLRPSAMPDAIAQAAAMLKGARTPLILTGGGAMEASADITALAESLGAIVCPSNAGKGVVPDDHPLSLGGAIIRPDVQAFLAEADVVLAVGTEIAETDSFVERLPLSAALIRVDIDPAKIADRYPAAVGIVADAALAMASLRAALEGHQADRSKAEANVRRLRGEVMADLNPSEAQHVRVLSALDAIAPRGTIWSVDATQLAYTGSFAMTIRTPRTWFYPAGFCTLGSAVPAAIGAKLAKPDTPVAAIVGDTGFMFTMPEIITAAEAGLALPIILWNNEALKQIRDDMDDRDIDRIGIEGLNPDFAALARACHCHAETPDSVEALQTAFTAALGADRPTLIIVNEDSDWLT